MRALLLSAFAALAVASSAAHADDPLRVVTTIPDLADIAREIGGERVDVQSIARGTENIHSVRWKPSLLVKLNKADLFVQVGLSLEHSYVPALLEAARNKRIRPGEPGFVNVSEGWEPVEIPEDTSRSQGTDLHPQGNPHINLDPRGGHHMADRILAGLVAVDPGHEQEYIASHAAYIEKLDEAAERWAVLSEDLAGKKVVTYHREFSYLARATGLVVVGNVEARPGVPPTPRELAELVQAMREEEVGVIVTARWSNDKSVKFVAEKTGARVLEVPTMVGGSKSATTWIGLMDELFQSLHDALAPPAEDGG